MAPKLRRGSWYEEPDAYENLNEVVGPPPVENPNEHSFYRHHSLEEDRSISSTDRGETTQSENLEPPHPNLDKSLPSEPTSSNVELSEVSAPPPVPLLSISVPTSSAIPSPSDSNLNVLPRPPPQPPLPSAALTKLYTISYLIFFSILGTLARLGLQALTIYSGEPVITPVLWANFAGSLVFGFLAEDKRLFREEWGNVVHTVKKRGDEEKQGGDVEAQRIAVGKKHGAVKKTIPLYIGFATGFCGSFTSFSSLVRDAFLAISDDLPTSATTRPRGDSFMALVAVILLTVCLGLSALKLGAHLALGLERVTPSLSFRFMRHFIDPLVVVLAFGCWIGAIIMAIFPPRDAWRGQAVFSLIFSPLGCLARYYASLHLNGKIASFPLGTFAVNIIGTALLGMFYDLQHVSLGNSVGGGMIGCQVLQGMMDGFCGCLTTVSTWVGELNGLRRRHAYLYGSASVLGGLSLLVIIMGSLRWTLGFSAPVCLT